MKSFLFTLALFSFCVFASAQSGPYNWTNVRSNIGQICPGLDFYSPTSGFILDFVSGPGPILLKTVDGGQTLTSALSSIDILIMENIVTSNNGQNAITGGVSLANEPVSIQSNNNGGSWQLSNTKVVSSTFNGLQVLPSGDIAFFGQWSTKTPSGKPLFSSSSGIAYSTNSGQSYVFFPWSHPTITPVAGNFVSDSSSTVVVIGSASPYVADDDSQEQDSPQDDKPIDYQKLVNFHRRQALADAPRDDFPANETYRSYVSISNDAGTTWKDIYVYEGVDNVTGVSLSGGYFLSATTGFIAGTNHTQAGSAAFLLGTTDGGNTWVQLIQLIGGIFMRVECISSTECFVIGGAPGGPLGNGVIYHTTNAGKSWTPSYVPKIAVLLDLSVVNSNVMYAVGVSAFQTCDLFYYGPPQ